MRTPRLCLVSVFLFANLMAAVTVPDSASGESRTWISVNLDADLQPVKAEVGRRGGELLTLAPEGRLLVKLPSQDLSTLSGLSGVTGVQRFEPPSPVPVVEQPRGLGERPPLADEQRRIDEVYSRLTRIKPNRLAELRALLGESGAPLAVADNSLSMYFPPIGNQGAQGSCTAWAACYYYSTYTQAQDEGLDASGANTDHICTPAFLYPLVNGGYDGGANTQYVVSGRVGVPKRNPPSEAHAGIFVQIGGFRFATPTLPLMGTLVGHMEHGRNKPRFHVGSL